MASSNGAADPFLSSRKAMRIPLLISLLARNASKSCKIYLISPHSSFVAESLRRLPVDFSAIPGNMLNSERKGSNYGTAFGVAVFLCSRDGSETTKKESDEETAE